MNTLNKNIMAFFSGLLVLHIIRIFKNVDFSTGAWAQFYTMMIIFCIPGKERAV